MVSAAVAASLLLPLSFCSLIHPGEGSLGVPPPSRCDCSLWPITRPEYDALLDISPSGFVSGFVFISPRPTSCGKTNGIEPRGTDYSTDPRERAKTAWGMLH